MRRATGLHTKGGVRLKSRVLGFSHLGVLDRHGVRDLAKKWIASFEGLACEGREHTRGGRHFADQHVARGAALEVKRARESIFGADYVTPKRVLQ